MKQLLAIVLVFAFVVALPGAALAQDAAWEQPPPFCGDLPAADCQLLTDSQAAMQSITSMTADVQVDVMLSGLPDMPELPFQFALNAVVHSDPAIVLDHPGTGRQPTGRPGRAPHGHVRVGARLL